MSTTHLNFYEDTGGKKGLAKWLTSTDHKRIGLMYGIVLTVFFIIAMLLGLTMKLELIAPGKTIIDAKTYNQLFTLHGVIMIFIFVIPGIPAVFGNFILPIILGAKDVAFPKWNLFSWYLYLAGALLAVASLFIGSGFADTGWTFYAPYSIKTDTNVIMAVTAAFLLGFSSILTGLNFLTTIQRMRAPGMTFFKMPLFAWSLYATAWIQLLATPVIGITLVMIIFERAFGIGLFDTQLGGDPILFQHLFWIYSHPAVYVMILPAMGVISEIIPTFSRRRIYGYKAIAYSSLAIAFIGYFVWAHHMFTAGMSNAARIFFSLLTFLVALPSAIKVFNWVATLYKGSIKVTAPLLYACGFIFLFLIGGLTGLLLGALAADIHVHDTYFVVGHFHYVMFGGTGFAFFAGLHYWFPKITGKMYNEAKAKLAFWIFIIGFNVLYVPMMIVGIMGMPRRYYDYDAKFHGWNMVSTVGSWILFIGFGMMIWTLVQGYRKGTPAGKNPWGGLTLEWQVDSPPTIENFEETPVVTEAPYNYK